MRLLEINQTPDIDRKIEAAKHELDFLSDVIRRAWDKKFVTYWNYNTEVPKGKFFYEEYEEGKWRYVVFTNRTDIRIRDSLRRTWNRLQKIKGKYAELLQLKGQA